MFFRRTRRAAGLSALASPGWQQAASAGARKKAAEQFLISKADGFFPPPFVRDELYAKAQRLFKSSGG
jgi:hypothetical protein